MKFLKVLLLMLTVNSFTFAQYHSRSTNVFVQEAFEQLAEVMTENASLISSLDSSEAKHFINAEINNAVRTSLKNNVDSFFKAAGIELAPTHVLKEFGAEGVEAMVKNNPKQLIETYQKARHVITQKFVNVERSTAGYFKFNDEVADVLLDTLKNTDSVMFKSFNKVQYRFYSLDTLNVKLITKASNKATILKRILRAAMPL